MSKSTYPETKLNSLLSQGYEDEVVEFKVAENNYDSNKLGKYFSALSNEANLKGLDAGWLVFGVRDKDKAIVGTQFRPNPSRLNSLKEEIAQQTTGGITFKEIHEVNTSEGRVLLFEIPAAPLGMPIAWKGHFYGRDGESLGALNPEEYERMRSQLLQPDWSAQIIETATLDDLSKDAIEQARELFKTKHPKLVEDVDRWDDITFLNKAKVTIKGNITNAALLLLGKEESEHFLTPATSKITWILKDRDNLEKDYEHFTCPLLLKAPLVFAKIRNLKYRYIADGSLFPEEVDQYDPFIIREALNNCIAHQDYSIGGKIIVVENEEGTILFANSGSFIPKNIEEVVIGDAPEFEYRNKFLANAMVNLNMIDTIGSGIKRMFVIQKDKYFPLPDYDFRDKKVKLKITGKVLDMKYAQKLALVKNLSLHEIMALDKVAKKQSLIQAEIALLKKKHLIEGRKPNFYISANVAQLTGEQADYIKQRGLQEAFYKKMILEYIEQYGFATRDNIRKLIKDHLPGVLDEEQKSNKIRNIISSMSQKDKSITNIGSRKYSKWIITKKR